MTNYKIGWQKYEDYLEKQMSSPLLEILTQLMATKARIQEEEEKEQELYSQYEENQEEQDDLSSMIPISPQLMEEISMLSSYECWIGHTNFDITHEIKNQLDKIEGVEILRILSRYRFFIGLGKLFEFKDVRQYIEENIIPE